MTITAQDDSPPPVSVQYGLDASEIDEAFRLGRIHWSRTKILTRVATAENEEAWLERALNLNGRRPRRKPGTRCGTCINGAGAGRAGEFLSNVALLMARDKMYVFVCTASRATSPLPFDLRLQFMPEYPAAECNLETRQRP